MTFYVDSSEQKEGDTTKVARCYIKSLHQKFIGVRMVGALIVARSRCEKLAL